MVDCIKQLCKSHGIQSLNQLEKMAGIGINTVYRWDDITPGVDKVSKVARVFGVTVDSILDNQTKMRG